MLFNDFMLFNSIDWNEYIMEDVLAPLYCKLLVHLNENIVQKIDGISKTKIYDLLPCPLPPQPWDGLAKALFPLLMSHNLLWSNLNGGRYLKVGDSYLLDTSDVRLEKKGLEKLEKLLLLEGLPIAVVNKDVISSFSQSKCVRGVVDSDLVRKTFHSSFNRPHPIFDRNNSNNSWSIIVENAIFLLNYCLFDIQQSKQGYAALHGLRLLPLENQSIGTISSNLDGQWYFMANETERSILQRCQDQVVVNPSLFPTDVIKHFESADFLDVCNIRKIQSVDVLKLLCSVIPKNWLDHNAIVTQRVPQQLSDEWFHLLWKYILENNLIELFSDVFPLVPVHFPASFASNSNQSANSATKISSNSSLVSTGGLAKISKRVPVISYSSDDKEFLKYIIEGLGLVGIFLLDDIAVQPFFHNPEFQKLIKSNGAKGLLESLKACSGNISKYSNQWSPRVRLAMRAFVITEIIEKMSKEELSNEDKDLLCNLPIWLTHKSTFEGRSTFPRWGSDNNDGNLNKLTFSVLNPAENYLGPTGVASELLDDKYVWVDGNNQQQIERESKIISKLGIKQLSLGEYFTVDVLERVVQGKLASQELRSVGLIVLNKLKALEQDQPGISKALGSCPMYPNGHDELMPANQMYDPDVGILVNILPPNYFPRTDYVKDATLFISLRQLGLRKEIDCDGILAAAKSIEQDQKVMIGALSSGPQGTIKLGQSLESHAMYKSTLERSKGILRYLETNLERLLEDCDPEGLLRFCAENRSQKTSIDNATAQEQETDASNRYKLGGSWGNEIRSTWWIAVYTKCPESFHGKGLPWPSRVHSTPFAAPCQVTPLSNLWFASSTLRICSMDIQSPVLMGLLGWDQPVGGNNIAIQLSNMSSDYQLTIESQSSSQLQSLEAIKRSYDEIFPSILSKLYDRFEVESEITVKHWITMLSKKSILWVGHGRFVESSRFAMKSVLSINTEPFLYVVPPSFQHYEKLLLGLGVKSSFQSIDLANLTCQLYQKYGSQPLSGESVGIHVGIIDVMFQLLQTEISGSPANVDSPIESKDIDDVKSESPVSPEEKMKITREHIQALGQIYIPDMNNCLALSSSLHYNDATWISAATLTEKFRSLRFVHSKVDLERAGILGCKSLRELLYAGEDVICPSVKQLKNLIEDDTVKDVLYDFLHIADLKNSEMIQVVYDSLTYGCESLLHPGLSAAQGPAILIHFPQCIMSFEDIGQMLILPSFTSAETGNAVKIISQSGELGPALGKRLLSSFTITDCLQILTGSEMYVFDPAGSFLQHERVATSEKVASSGKQPTLRRLSSKLDRINQANQKQPGNYDGQPKAQRYKLNGKKNSPTSPSSTPSGAQQDQNLLTSFGDQFSPFMSVLPENIRQQFVTSRSYNGTIVRLPLRSNRSPLSRNVISETDISSFFGGFKGAASASLIFAKTLRSFSLFRTNEEKQLNFSYSIEVNPNCLQDRANRLKLLQSSGWERQGLVKLFSSYVPPEYASIIKVVTRIGDVTWLKLSSSLKLMMDQLIGGSSGKMSQMAVEDQFFVHGCMGFNPLKDLAITEPYKGLRLLPFVSIAIPLVPSYELPRFDIAPEPGVQIYNACITNITGLPFHTEGFFIHSDNKRPAQSNISAQSLGGVVGSAVGKVNVIQQWNDAIFVTALQKLYPGALTELKRVVTSNAMSSQYKERYLSGFYKYWIFQPRLHPVVKMAVKTSGTLVTLSASDQSNFLFQSTFTTLDKVVLPLHDLSTESAAYLSSTIHLAGCPTQIGRDLQENRVSLLELSPERLRAYMKRDVLIHAGSLAGASRSIWIELVRYVMRDLDLVTSMSNPANVASGNSTGEGEFAKKRNMKKLAGCPLLLTADERIKCFPNNVNERKAFVPLNFYDFLPVDLFGHVISPLMMETFGELLMDPCCQEVLFISPFNAQFVKQMIQFFLPPLWSMNKAIHWIPDADITQSGGVGQYSIAGYSSLRTFELLLYCIWNFAFMKETAVGLSSMNEIPLLPVTSNGRRILIPVESIKHTFVAFPNAFEDRYRRGLRQEIESASASAASRRGQAVQFKINDGQDINQEDWKWTQRRAAADELVAVDDTFREVGEDDSEIVQENDIQVEVAPSSQAPADTPAAQVPGNGVNASLLDEPIEVDGGSNSPYLQVATYNVVSQLGLPFLDGFLFEGVPVAALLHHQRTVHYGAKLLEALFFFHDSQINVFNAHDSVGGSAVQTCLVDFNKLAVADRTTLLLDIYAAHRTESFSDSQLSKLKSLPLFTNCFDATVPVVLSDCRNGLYWCSDEQVLQTWKSRDHSATISAASSSMSPNSSSDQIQPVVLVHNPQLRDIYRWLQIQELTPSIAVSQFILPVMNSMSCVERVQLIKRLASNWGSYKTDRSLVDALKAQSIIPPWTMSDPEGWQRQNSAVTTASAETSSIRRCNELLLWTNTELMECLHGESLPKYFVPPSLRSPELHSLFSDLGMKSDVTEETFLAIITDIQTDAVTAQQSKDDSKLQDCIQRGRRILHYILSGDRSSTLFDNNTFARKVGKIMFVPMKLPLQMEEGGYVVYQDDVGRFDQFISKPHGMTAFSVLPLLEEDVTPSTIYFSSLGIMNAPNREVVLRHVRNLIKANHLERWNVSFYTPQQTFNAIFQFLADNWRSLSNAITEKLKEEAIVPVGNLLVPPNRIFFRLTEDLAPFMHELPRHFGAHEQFLKTSLGIREAPGSMDYVHFLSDLAKELRTASLNPNELRAIVTISQTIAHQLENVIVSPKIDFGKVGAQSIADEQLLLQRNSTARKKFFIPDENSIMRNIDQCIVNDDPSLRGKIGGRLEQLGLFVIHPLLSGTNSSVSGGSISTNNGSNSGSTSFGKILGLHSLTELFKEKLEDSKVIPLSRNGGSDVEFERKYHEKMLQIFNDPSFLSILTSLVARNEYEKSATSSSIASSNNNDNKQSGRGTNEMQLSTTEYSVQHQLNAMLQLRFVQDLATTLVLVNPADPRQESSVFASNSTDNLDRPLFYLHCPPQQRSILYVNVGRSRTTGINIEVAISLGICQLFHLDRIFASMIAEVMTIQEKDGRMNLAEVYHLKDDFQASQFLLRGSPGALLTSTDLALIELRPMRLYRVGEIVAYEELEGGATAINASHGNKYYYGKIVAVGEANDMGVRKLDVKTGRGVQKVLSTSIFAFKSARGTVPANESTLSPSSVISWMTRSSVTVPSTQTSSSGVVGNINNSIKQESDVIHRDELLSALHGLLDRAGFPVTLNQKVIVNR